MSGTTTQHQHHHESKSPLLFWIYLMTDLIMFAVLFATYAALKTATAGKATGAEIFDLPFVLGETLILLTSSFTCGLVMVATEKKRKNEIIGWLIVTFLLGASFLAMELFEFNKLISEGNGPGASAFLSALFALLGTHGIHIAIGLLWLVIMIVFIQKRGLTATIVERIKMFSLFWHFLDVVWIFIFTMVYLLGKI